VPAAKSKSKLGASPVVFDFIPLRSSRTVKTPQRVRKCTNLVWFDLDSPVPAALAQAGQAFAGMTMFTYPVILGLAVLARNPGIPCFYLRALRRSNLADLISFHRDCFAALAMTASHFKRTEY
jgi:hypothetical protein